MHARVLTLQIREGNLDRVLHILKEVVIPAASRQEGFAAFVVMSDRKANRVVGTSLWQTEADMLASERKEYFQDQISRVITLVAGPPQIDHYEVDALS